MADIAGRLRNEAAFPCERCPALAAVGLVVVEGQSHVLLCDDCARAVGLALLATQPGPVLGAPEARPGASSARGASSGASYEFGKVPARSGVCPMCGQVVSVVPLTAAAVLWWQVDDHQRPVLGARMGHAGEWVPCSGVGLLVPAHATSPR